MEMEIILDKKEAQATLGLLIKSQIAGELADRLKVESVAWDDYGQRVTVRLVDKDKEDSNVP